ncbi:MAG: LPS export ABC transporter permease LptG [Burkholderiaceae bacterium]
MAQSRTFERYVARGIYGRIGFVLLGFVGLFALFDLVAELEDIGRGSYRIQEAMQYIALRIPAMSYELMPVATLIGALWALSSLAASSEYTVARASGFRPADALKAMARLGLPLVLLTALLSELIVPWSEAAGSKLRASALGSVSADALRSGYWLRDSVKGLGVNAAERMLNLRGATPDQRLLDVVIYEFDASKRLLRVVRAKQAVFDQLVSASGGQQASRWALQQTTSLTLGSDGGLTKSTADRLEMISSLSPNTLGALLVKPDQMSARDLWAYSRYLKAGRQSATRYELAFWKKVIYPVACWVMLLMALPAAYLQARGGTVGLKVFLGIVFGVAFHLLNSLFSHLGAMNTWPAPLVAAIPSLVALTFALVMLVRVQRRSL